MREIASYQLPSRGRQLAWFQPPQVPRPDGIAGLVLWLSGERNQPFAVLSDGTGMVRWDGDPLGWVPAHNDAVLVGTAAHSPTDRRPRWVSDEVRGGALSFNSTDVASQLRGYGGTSGLNFVHESGHFTIAAHVRRKNLAPHTLLTTNRASSGTRGFYLGTGVAQPDRLWFFITDGVASHWYSAQELPADDAWHFVCVRGNGTHVQICIDGVWETAEPLERISTGEATSALEVGAYGTGATSGLKGELDDVVIYRRPLTDAEVAALRRYNRREELIHPPRGYSHFYWADDLDGMGLGNLGMAEGDLIESWAGFKGANVAMQSAIGLRPSLVRTPQSRAAVAFGIAEDRLEIAESTSGMAFLHETGHFHLLMVLRKDAAVDMSPLANTNTTHERGFMVQLRSDGTVRGTVTRGVEGEYVMNVTSTATLPVGKWSMVELWGAPAENLAGVSVGNTPAVTAPLGELAAGEASRTCWIGGRPAVTPTGYFDGQIAMIALWPRKLSAAERTVFREQLRIVYDLE